MAKKRKEMAKKGKEMAKKRKEQYEIRAAGGRVVGVVDNFYDVAQRCWLDILDREQLQFDVPRDILESCYFSWSSELILSQDGSFEQDFFKVELNLYFDDEYIDADSRFENCTFRGDIQESYFVYFIFADEIETQKNEIETQEVQQIIDELKSLYPKLKILVL